MWSSVERRVWGVAMDISRLCPLGLHIVTKLGWYNCSFFHSMSHFKKLLTSNRTTRNSQSIIISSLIYCSIHLNRHSKQRSHQSYLKCMTFGKVSHLHRMVQSENSLWIWQVNVIETHIQQRVLVWPVALNALLNVSGDLLKKKLDCSIRLHSLN